MMYLSSSSILALSTLALSANAQSFEGRVHELEKMYIDDCARDTSPHGFYGAFLQPCEFSFFEGGTDSPDGDACESGSLVGQPTPVNWSFKLAEHMDKDDWDSLSSDDIPDMDELMLWPDQCVAVSPRCYNIGDNQQVADELRQLFPDGYPIEATHVRVDCRADAKVLADAVYSFASGLEKSTPTIVAWLTTVLVFFLVAMSFCCYGCCLVCKSVACGESKHEAYHAVPVVAVDATESYSDEKAMA